MTDAEWWAKVREQLDAQQPGRLGGVSAPWTLWTLTRDGHKATAAARAIHGIGLDYASRGNGELRVSQVYRQPEAFSEDANAKRVELLDGSWQER